MKVTGIAALGVLAGIAVVLMGAAANWLISVLVAVCLLLPTLAGIAALVASMRRAKTQAAQVVLDRAEYEHQALLRGDTATGMYGRWQPPSI